MGYNRLQNFTLILALISFVGIFGFWVSAYALEPMNLNIDNYPSIPVPESLDKDGQVDGVFDLDCLRIGSCEFESTELISFFLGFIYYTSLWLAGIIAFLSLIYAGSLYVFSGQIPGNRAKAQEQITAVVWGILILFFAVVAFTTVNPDIASLKITGQHAVEEGDATHPSANTGGGDNNTYSCKWDSTFEECHVVDNRCNEGLVGREGSCNATTQEECEGFTPSECVPPPSEEEAGTFTCEPNPNPARDEDPCVTKSSCNSGYEATFDPNTQSEYIRCEDIFFAECEENFAGKEYTCRP